MNGLLARAMRRVGVSLPATREDGGGGPLLLDSPLGALPTAGHRPRDPGAGPPAPGDRAVHAWFPHLARRHAATGDREAARRACERLGAWLVADRAGEGPDWRHPSDAALRLVAWNLGIGWLGDALDPDLRRRIAGSALRHARWLEDRLPLRRTDARAVVHAAGLVVAGLTWPGHPGARRRWASGLSLLGRVLPGLLHADGFPLARDVAIQRRLVEASLAAWACCRVAGVAFPEAAQGAMVRAAWALRCLSDAVVEPPALGEGAALPVLPPLAARPWTLPWKVLVAAGLVQGEGAPAGDEDLVEALAGRPAPRPATLVPDEGWNLLAFRDAGVAVAWGRVRGRATRLALLAGAERALPPRPDAHHDGLQVCWDLEDRAVLVDPGGDPEHPELRAPAAHDAVRVDGRGVLVGEVHRVTLERARVDGRKVRLRARVEEPRGARWTREVLQQGARLVVTDRLPGLSGRLVELGWTLGPGWRLEPAEGGGWVGRQGGLELTFLPPEGLRFEARTVRARVGGVPVEVQRLEGRGVLEGDARLRSSFELR